MAFADTAPAASAKDAAAPVKTVPSKAAVTPSLPSHKSGPADEIWAAYFKTHKPTERHVGITVRRLHELDEQEHVIQLIQAALINGQSQPWMYEMLALSMELAGRPKEDVQRIILSMTDFGAANFENMIFSAAYLARLNRDEGALRLYRQASRMAPERAEPYILGLRLARRLKQPDDVGWAAVGILKHGWTADYKTVQRDAENAVLEASEWLADNKAAREKLQHSVAEAKRRDLMITLTWNGSADLDLYVDEPLGTVCSFESRETAGGGIHLHDGYGPMADNCNETYVCPLAVSGEYRIRVRHEFGDVVGKRAQLTIVRHLGSENESTKKQTIQLTDEDAVITIRLEQGRRKQPRRVSSVLMDTTRALRMAAATRHLNRPDRLSPEEEQALRRFQEARRLSDLRIHAQTTGGGGGAVGFQPIVQTVADGTSVTMNAIVSPDRRYVRLAINPIFSSLTDVFTFSFVSGTDPFGGRNTGLGN